MRKTENKNREFSLKNTPKLSFFNTKYAIMPSVFLVLSRTVLCALLVVRLLEMKWKGLIVIFDEGMFLKNVSQVRFS